METKTTRGGLQIKDSGGRWEVSGIASVFGDPPDLQGDVVVPGAFRESIARRKTKLLLQHEELIGGEVELREDATGLRGTWFISKTDVGARVRQLAVDQVLDAFSIGYQVVDAEQRRDGVRLLKKVDLLEVSLVTWGACPGAVVTSAKAAGRGHKALDLAVELELARRRLTRQGILPPEGLGIRVALAGARIRMRERHGLLLGGPSQRRRGR